MRISDWGSDVCSSDLLDEPGNLPLLDHFRDRGDAEVPAHARHGLEQRLAALVVDRVQHIGAVDLDHVDVKGGEVLEGGNAGAEIVEANDVSGLAQGLDHGVRLVRSEEHTSELQSLMRLSYAV